MKRATIILLLVCFTMLFFNAMAAKKDSLKGGNKILFTENKAQWRSDIKFEARLENGKLFLHNNSLTFDLVDSKFWKSLSEFKANRRDFIKQGEKLPDKIKKHAYKINFLNSNKFVDITAEKAVNFYTNYFIGDNKNKWASKVRSYEVVYYKDIYKNTDFRIYSSNDGFLKYDFILKSAENHEKIQLEYEGVNNIKLSNKNLIISTNVQKIIELKPYAYFINESGNKQEVDVNFEVNGNILSFNISEYPKKHDLIIDPVIVFSTYSGSFADNWGYTATYDSKGFLYAGGVAFNHGYPTNMGAYDTSFSGGATDIVISKYDTSGSYMIYSTYLGGSGSETPSSLVVNSNDELFVLGTSSSANYPTFSNSVDNTFGGGNSQNITGISFSGGTDIVISRFNNNGTALLASTYFGGNQNDGLNLSLDLKKNYADELRGEIIIDNNDNCIVASSTYSSNINTSSNVFQSNNNGGQEGLVFKLDNNLSTLIWASYIGGSSDDAVYSLALDELDNIYVTGGTKSINFPVTSSVSFPNYHGNVDGFVSKISSYGNQLLASQYFGTSRYDQSYFVDTDRDNNVYLLGQTADTTSNIIINAQWNNPNGGQFICKLSSNLNNVIWSTKWGDPSPGIDVSPSAFMVDLCNRIYLSAWGGNTNSFGNTNGLPITANAHQATTDGSDYYLMVISSDASNLDYASFMGGSFAAEHVDGGTSRFDSKGHIYQSVCAGCGGYDDFPTTSGCHSSQNNSTNCNNAVFKFDFSVPVVIADFDQPQVLCSPATINFVNRSHNGSSSNSNYYWDFGNGNTSTQNNPTYTYNNSGLFSVQLIISDNSSCNLADTITKNILVLDSQTDTLPTIDICPGDITQIGIPPLNDPNLSYQWDYSPTLSQLNVSNPIASPNSTTYYKLTISNGVCTDTIIQKVMVYDISVDAGNDTTMCLSSITLKASANYPNLKYHWSSNNAFTDTLNSSFTSNQCTTSVNSPTYFYVKALRGSCYSIDSILVDKLIKITDSVQEPLCHGDNNAFIKVFPFGGNGPYTYNWSNGASTNTNGSLGVGTYSVTVTDQNNCIAEETYVINQPAELISNSHKINIPCKDACIGEAFADVSGGTPPYNWQWDDNSNQTTNPATQLCDGQYIATIKDSNNCIIKDTVEIIDSSQFMNFNAWIDGNIDTIYEGQSVNLNSTNFGSNYMYTWTPAQGLNDNSIHNPEANPNTSQVYYVTVTDQYGCVWEDSVFIYVTDVICDDPYIYIPNSFTPNGDGLNDVIYVRGNVIYDVEFKIFNRWGELVFETTDINQGWDGTYKGKMSEPGVFHYYVKIICYNKEIYNKKGNINLIR